MEIERLLTGREAAHRHAQRQIGAQARQDRLGALVQAAPVDADQRPSGIDVPQEDVFGGVEVGDQVQFLVDEGQAVARRIMHMVPASSAGHAGESRRCLSELRRPEF